VYNFFTVVHLIDVMLNMFAAGSDTVTNTTLFALLYLLKNPAIMDRLQNEIDYVTGNSNTVQLSDRAK